jgi:hypothetical protein
MESLGLTTEKGGMALSVAHMGRGSRVYRKVRSKTLFEGIKLLLPLLTFEQDDASSPVPGMQANMPSLPR